MDRNLLILTKNELTFQGKKTPFNDLTYSHFKQSPKGRNGFFKSDVVVFVENPNLIVLKDRNGSFTDISYTSTNSKNTRKRYRELKTQIKRPCPTQTNYLFDVLHDSDRLNVPNSERLTILQVLLRNWYPDTYSSDLNEIRRKYVNILTLGELT